MGFCLTYVSEAPHLHSAVRYSGTMALVLLLLVFIGAAAIVWIAGNYLSDSVDVLSTRFGLGEALGGLILLALATNLPEIAIVVSGALRGSLDLAVGNILGGIAAQTVVLVILDVFGEGRKTSLTYQAASITLVLEGLLVIAVLGLCVAGTQMPASLVIARMEPMALLVAAMWVVGLWLIGKARKQVPWHDSGNAPDAQQKPRGHSKKQKESNDKKQGGSTGRTLLVFGASALATLVCGVALEQSGDAIANHIGLSGVLFGATVLAAATSLPEVSTGLASMKLGDVQLAVSDIFGGNAFLPVLFLVASLISGKAVLPHAHKSDIFLTALGMLLTSVYIAGLLFRPRRQIARMGIDSFLVLIFYVLGLGGLFVLSRHGG